MSVFGKIYFTMPSLWHLLECYLSRTRDGGRLESLLIFWSLLRSFISCLEHCNSDGLYLISRLVFLTIWVNFRIIIEIQSSFDYFSNFRLVLEIAKILSVKYRGLFNTKPFRAWICFYKDKSVLRFFHFLMNIEIGLGWDYIFFWDMN